MKKDIRDPQMLIKTAINDFIRYTLSKRKKVTAAFLEEHYNKTLLPTIHVLLGGGSQGSNPVIRKYFFDQLIDNITACNDKIKIEIIRFQHSLVEEDEGMFSYDYVESIHGASLEQLTSMCRYYINCGNVAKVAFIVKGINSLKSESLTSHQLLELLMPADRETYIEITNALFALTATKTLAEQGASFISTLLYYHLPYFDVAGFSGCKIVELFQYLSLDDIGTVLQMYANLVVNGKKSYRSLKLENAQIAVLFINVIDLLDGVSLDQWAHFYVTLPENESIIKFILDTFQLKKIDLNALCLCIFRHSNISADRATTYYSKFQRSINLYQKEIFSAALSINGLLHLNRALDIHLMRLFELKEGQKLPNHVVDVIAKEDERWFVHHYQRVYDDIVLDKDLDRNLAIKILQRSNLMPRNEADLLKLLDKRLTASECCRIIDARLNIWDKESPLHIKTFISRLKKSRDMQHSDDLVRLLTTLYQIDFEGCAEIVSLNKILKSALPKIYSEIVIIDFFKEEITEQQLHVIIYLIRHSHLFKRAPFLFNIENTLLQDAIRYNRMSHALLKYSDRYNAAELFGYCLPGLAERISIDVLRPLLMFNQDADDPTENEKVYQRLHLLQRNQALQPIAGHLYQSIIDAIVRYGTMPECETLLESIIGLSRVDSALIPLLINTILASSNNSKMAMMDYILGFNILKQALCFDDILELLPLARFKEFDSGCEQLLIDGLFEWLADCDVVKELSTAMFDELNSDLDKASVVILIACFANDILKIRIMSYLFHQTSLLELLVNSYTEDSPLYSVSHAKMQKTLRDIFSRCVFVADRSKILQNIEDPMSCRVLPLRPSSNAKSIYRFLSQGNPITFYNILQSESAKIDFLVDLIVIVAREFSRHIYSTSDYHADRSPKCIINDFHQFNDFLERCFGDEKAYGLISQPELMQLFLRCLYYWQKENDREEFVRPFSVKVLRSIMAMLAKNQLDDDNIIDTFVHVYINLSEENQPNMFYLPNDVVNKLSDIIAIIDRERDQQRAQGKVFPVQNPYKYLTNGAAMYYDGAEYMELSPGAQGDISHVLADMNEHQSLDDSFVVEYH